MTPPQLHGIKNFLKSIFKMLPALKRNQVLAIIILFYRIQGNDWGMWIQIIQKAGDYWGLRFFPIVLLLLIT